MPAFLVAGIFLVFPHLEDASVFAKKESCVGRQTVVGPIADAELEIPKVIKSQAAKVVRVARLVDAGHFASGSVEIGCKI